ISSLQIPLFATPLFSHRYKTPGVWGCRLSIFTSVPVPRWQVPCSQQVAASLSSLCPLFALFSALVPFVLKSLQPLFAKHPGGGYPASTAKTKTKGHAGACPLHNSSQLRVSYAPAPLEKLPTASASVLYTSKTVRSLVICRTS